MAGNNNLSVTSIEYQYYDKFIANSANYPTIDRSIDPNNITKFTYYDELLKSLKDLIQKDPEKLKHYLNEVSNPAHSQLFKYPDKSLYIRRKFFNGRGKLVTFKRDMVAYPLKFGNFSEDSFVMDIYLDGRRLEAEAYEVHDGVNSKVLYIDSTRVGNNTEVHVCINRSYSNNKLALQYVNLNQGDENIVIEVDINVVGRHHYSTKNFIVHLLRKGNGNHFKLLEKGKDYTIGFKSGSSTILEVSLSAELQLEEGDYISVVNKLTSFRLAETVNVTNPIIPLVCKSTIDLPFPIENIHETDVYVNGYHLTPEIDYYIEWNKEDDTLPPYMKFYLPFPKDADLEIFTNTENERSINVQKQMYSMEQRGFVSVLDKDIPLDVNYLKVYVDNRRVPTKNLKVLADSILLIRGVRSITNIDIRTFIPSSAGVNNLLEAYTNNKSELRQYVESVGFEFFINRYANLNNIQPIEVNEKILYEIDIQLNKSLTFKNYSDIDYKVIATYNDGSYRDVTLEAFVSYVDTGAEGNIKINATYVENGVSKYTEKDILVTGYETNKILFDIDIYTNKLLTINKTGKDIDFKVIATFHDNTAEDVTKVSNIETRVEEDYFVIEAKYSFNGVTINKTKRVKIKLIVNSTIRSLTVLSNKKEIFANESIEFTAIVNFDDGSSKNVTIDTIFSKLDRTKIGTQTITASYSKEGFTVYGSIDVKIKDGETNDLDVGIQKLNKVVATGATFETFTENGVDYSSILFRQDISNSLIVIDGLFYVSGKYDKNRLLLPSNTYINQSVIDRGGVVIYSWDKIYLETKVATTNQDNYLEFETGVTKEHALFYNGTVVNFDINPVNGRQIKIRDIDQPELINPHALTAIRFKSLEGDVVGLGKDFGKVDYVGGKVMFAQNMNDFIILYNGVNHEYNINTAKPTDIYYEQDSIEYISETAVVVGLALYVGSASIGHYTDDRLNEIKNELSFSYDSVVAEYRDIVEINADGQIMFDLDYTPLNNLPTVILNGMYINNKNANGDDYWIVDTYNKKLIWLITPDNFGDEGLVITKDMSLIVIYDYIQTKNRY